MFAPSLREYAHQSKAVFDDQFKSMIFDEYIVFCGEVIDRADDCIDVAGKIKKAENIRKVSAKRNKCKC